MPAQCGSTTWTQLSPAPRRSTWRAFCRGVVFGVVGSSLFVGFAVTGYVVKSAAGINLFPGKSVFHEQLWPVAVAVRQRVASVRQAF